MQYTYEEIKDEIIKIIREEIGWNDNGCTLGEETRLIDDLELDSVMIVQLIVTIEEKFQMEFSDSEDLLKCLETIGSLTKDILERTKGFGKEKDI
ncbi:MAG: hypothetical protein HFI34_04380 [Lachnospiraceae bacterium]|nr:hypothetical protein [Lachnospiraceae bacterium]